MRGADQILGQATPAEEARLDAGKPARLSPRSPAQPLLTDCCGRDPRYAIVETLRKGRSWTANPPGIGGMSVEPLQEIDLKKPSSHVETTAFRIPADLASLVLIGVFWIITSALVNPVGEFPVIDEWVYASAVKSILVSGRFELHFMTAANVFVQAYWGALFCLPFGFSFTALRISTLTLGVGGIFACYFLLREIGGSPWVALMGALTLAVNPLYFELAHTFMTDVPFLALVIAALFLFVRGFRRQKPVSLLAGILVALLAILIRQFGLLLLLAFGVAYIVRMPKSWRALVVAVLPLVVGVGLQMAYHYWVLKTGRIPFFWPDNRFLRPPSVAAFVDSSWRIVMGATPYIGFFGTPFIASVALSGGRADGQKRWLICLLAAALASVVVVGLYLERSPMPDGRMASVLMPTGLGPLMLRDTNLHQNLPEIPISIKILWIALNIIGALCGAGIMLYIVHTSAFVSRTLWDLRCRCAISVLILVFVVGYAGVLLLYGSNTPLQDRYLLVFFPAIFVLVLLDEIRSGPIVIPRWRRVVWVLFLLVYTAFAVAGTHDFLAWNRLRWVATRTLMDASVLPNQIDGGYEFNGWLLSPYQVINESGWYNFDDEYVIASGPLSGYAELQRFTFRHWLPVSDATVVILHRLDLGHR
jgi:4-amino-4-deoxy-L-arabinose transferase-like glycosyltransferase